MKRLIAVALSVFVFIAVFSGCGFNISNPEKITQVTSAAVNTDSSENEPAASAEASQTTAKPAQTTTKPAQTTTKPAETTSKPGIQKDGVYTTKDDVSLYIHNYNKLPNNFITKTQAQALNWPGGNLEPYAPGKCIGGDYFSNYEKLLPIASGRKYYECDIDTLGATSRGAKRIVYSNDGLVYYTADHYVSFIKIY